MEAILDQLEPFATRLQGAGLTDLKPWGEFLSKFKPPKKWTRDEVEKRVEANLMEYKANYLVVSSCIFLFMLCTSPLLLLTLLICVCLWAYVMVVRKAPLIVNGTELDGGTKAMGCAAATLLVLVLSGQFLKLLGTLSLAVLAVAAHLVFKPRNVKSKFDRHSNDLQGTSAKASGVMGGLFSGKKGAKRDEDVSGPDDMEGGVCRGDNGGGSDGEGDTVSFSAGDNATMRKRH